MYDEYGPRVTYTCTGGTSRYSCEITDSESIYEIREKTVYKEVPAGAYSLCQSAVALLVAAYLSF